MKILIFILCFLKFTRAESFFNVNNLMLQILNNIFFKQSLNKKKFTTEQLNNLENLDPNELPESFKKQLLMSKNE